MRSATLLPIRMNAAETRASRAMADCTPLTVNPSSFTIAEIDTFMIDVSTTRTNIAIASRIATRELLPVSSPVSSGATVCTASVIGLPWASARDAIQGTVTERRDADDRPDGPLRLSQEDRHARHRHPRPDPGRVRGGQGRPVVRRESRPLGARPAAGRDAPGDGPPPGDPARLRRLRRRGLPRRAAGAAGQGARDPHRLARQRLPVL